MHRMMVYDMSRGYLNPRIIRADSGRLVMDKSKKFLVLKLYQGQSFENIQTQSYNTVSEPVPYMLPHFDYSETFIPFDANIKMQDEGELSSMYVGKNLHQLQVSIDSIRPILDSTRNSYARIVQSDLLTSHYRLLTLRLRGYHGLRPPAGAYRYSRERDQRSEAGGSQGITHTHGTRQLAGYRLRPRQGEAYHGGSQIYTGTDDTEFYHYRTFHQEWHRKFTFPVSCIIFALIGASLGAIVRRGGDRDAYHHLHLLLRRLLHHRLLRYEQLRSESIPIWLGMWLSNILLFPVGIFLAYKANQDSSALNVEAYVIFFRKLFGFRGVRKVEYQELIIEEADYEAGAAAVAQAIEHTDALLRSPMLSGRIWQIWSNGSEQQALAALSEELDAITESLRHTPSRLLVSKLCDLPLLPTRLSPLPPRGAALGPYTWSYPPHISSVWALPLASTHPPQG